MRVRLRALCLFLACAPEPEPEWNPYPAPGELERRWHRGFELEGEPVAVGVYEGGAAAVIGRPGSFTLRRWSVQGAVETVQTVEFDDDAWRVARGAFAGDDFLALARVDTGVDLIHVDAGGVTSLRPFLETDGWPPDVDDLVVAKVDADLWVCAVLAEVLHCQTLDGGTAWEDARHRTTQVAIDVQGRRVLGVAGGVRFNRELFLFSLTLQGQALVDPMGEVPCEFIDETQTVDDALVLPTGSLAVVAHWLVDDIPDPDGHVQTIVWQENAAACLDSTDYGATGPAKFAAFGDGLAELSEPWEPGASPPHTTIRVRVPALAPGAHTDSDYELLTATGISAHGEHFATMGLNSDGQPVVSFWRSDFWAEAEAIGGWPPPMP